MNQISVLLISAFVGTMLWVQPLQAQSWIMPHYICGVVSGGGATLDVSKVKDSGAVGTGLTVFQGWRHIGIMVTAAHAKGQNPKLNAFSFGACLAYTFFDDCNSGWPEPVPIEVGGGGIGLMLGGTYTRVEDGPGVRRSETEVPLGIYVRQSEGPNKDLPFWVPLWAQFRLDFTRTFGNNIHEFSTVRAGLMVGIDCNLDIGLGVHAGVEVLGAETWGVGLHYVWSGTGM